MKTPGIEKLTCFNAHRETRSIPALAMTVLAALALAGCATMLAPGNRIDFATAIQNSDRLIVPGDRIGPIRVGMSRDEVVRILGRPDRVINYLDSSDVEYIYDNNHFVVGLSVRWWAVIDVWTYDPQFATEQGVRPGDSRNDVLQKQGNPKYDQGYHMDYEGPEQIFMDAFNRGLAGRSDPCYPASGFGETTWALWMSDEMEWRRG